MSAIVPPFAFRGLAGGTALMVAVLLGSPPSQAQVPASATQETVTRLQVRVGELERLVQDLTGRVEEALYQNRQLQDKLKSNVGDIEYRLDALEGNPTRDTGTAAPGKTTPAKPGAVASPPATGVLTPPGKQGPASSTSLPTASATPNAGTLPDGSENDQYNYAFSLLRNSDYPSAEQALKAFIQKYPKGKLTGNAQYWLGETYYVRGDFEQAAVAFMSGYQNFPDSSKGPDNLLKLGLALANLNKTREACAAFGRLEGQYPKATDAIKRRAQSEIGRLGC
ncbi:tol-pal system protein YbgF [Pararhodospirillum photometricum]|uniref:Cell division coordinator CpoB n=1 Tax=Pararhodospirillum photometricum DSM 122 TaxID=1150469 RepID=H6SK77_PARPM|nr:tol-pal system protein YbgF [Pararhodospirillum photometricum]CCG08392.1 Putative uncharacterized protein [Pararhodospirillum photometricum DSM 122]